jgi:hypothetical protein
MALTYPIPQIAAEEYVDAADWNALVDSINFLANPPACRVHNSAAQNLANNAGVALTFNSERFDTAAMHSTVTQTSRITAPVAGLYTIAGHVQIQGDTDFISVVVDIRLNGTTPIATVRDQNPGVSANQKMFSVSTIYKLAAGDYVELVVTQENTSGGINTTIVSAGRSPEFVAAWIGKGT